MKSETIAIRIESDLLDKIRQQAQKEGRTIAKEIAIQLKEKEKETEKVETWETYAEYCRNHIADNLELYIGETFENYIDLSISLTESENINGSATFSTYKAEQFIKAWFDNVGVFLNEYQQDLGELPTHNPFTDQELFHCLMLIYGVQNILANVSKINDNAEPFILTQELAEHIKKEIEKFFPLNNYQENHEGK